MEPNYNRANELLARNVNYEKVICVASSAIASLLLSGGTTAHSRFKIPLVCDGSSTYNVSPTDQVCIVVGMGVSMANTRVESTQGRWAVGQGMVYAGRMRNERWNAAA